MRGAFWRRGIPQRGGNADSFRRRKGAGERHLMVGLTDGKKRVDEIWGREPRAG